MRKQPFLVFAEGCMIDTPYTTLTAVSVAVAFLGLPTGRFVRCGTSGNWLYCGSAWELLDVSQENISQLFSDVSVLAAHIVLIQ